MKNKNLLVALSKLLKIDESVIVAASDKEDGDDSILKDFNTKHQIFSLDELSTLIKNSNKAFLDKADFDINDVPKALYSKISAAAFESKEKALAKELGIEKYDGLQDLLNKAIESKAGKGIDEATKQQIDTLKATIKTLEQEKETEVGKVRSQFDSEFINRDLGSALQTVSKDLDYDDPIAVEKQTKLLNLAFGASNKAVRKEGKTIVLDKDDKPVVDKLGDPMPISDVLRAFATDNGFKFKAPETGGRGASSSEPVLSLKGVSFEKVLEAKGIKPNTDESDKAFAEWKAANKN